MSGRQLVNVKQLAELTGISKEKLYEMRREGEIPAVAFGSRYQFEPEAVLEALRAKSEDQRRPTLVHRQPKSREPRGLFARLDETMRD